MFSSTTPSSKLPAKVEPALNDLTIGHKNVVCQDRWSLVTGCYILMWVLLPQKCVVSWEWPLKKGFTVLNISSANMPNYSVGLQAP